MMSAQEAVDCRELHECLQRFTRLEQHVEILLQQRARFDSLDKEFFKLKVQSYVIIGLAFPEFASWLHNLLW